MGSRSALVGCLLTLLPISAVLADWGFYEETNVKGTIRGTIKKGTVLQMQSGSIYEVTGLTLQLVLELAPKAIVLTDGAEFKVSIDGFDEPLTCKQLVPPNAGRATGRASQETTPRPTSTALADTPLEKLMSPDQQRQMGIDKLTSNEREQLRVYLINLYLLGVKEGQETASASPSSKTTPPSTASVVESQIDGNFEGWAGETIFKLSNGQIWQQATYAYTYHYAFRPKVLIFKTNSAYKMKVEGVDGTIFVKRLK